MLDLMPADTPCYMADAWLSAIDFTLGNPEAVSAFRLETGFNWKPGSNPIERAIDEVAEMPEHFLRAFIPWFNVHVWGPIDGPAADTKAGQP